MKILAPISAGELVDKIAILSTKLDRLEAPEKKTHVQNELDELIKVADEHQFDAGPLGERLRIVNQELWDIEDRIRLLERSGSFGEEFIALARSIYLKNDERARIKHEIDVMANSFIREQKSY